MDVTMSKEEWNGNATVDIYLAKEEKYKIRKISRSSMGTALGCIYIHRLASLVVAAKRAQ